MKRIPAPGRLCGGLHVLEQGSGPCTVVLEAGIAATSLSWCLVQSRVAEFARVISYDRAGFGWSEVNDTGGGTAVDAARGLAAMLNAYEVTSPVVLAGHSFGGLIARVFQQQYPERVRALLLIDPVVREEWKPGDARLRRGAMLSRRGASLARLGIVRLSLSMLLSGSHRLPRLFAKASAGRGASVADRLAGEIRKMPKELWPAIAMHWSEARSFETMARNLEQLPVSVRQVEEGRTLGGLPLTILSARPTAEHQRDAALSSRGQNRVVPGTGHWIQLDRPDAVVEALRSFCA